MASSDFASVFESVDRVSPYEGITSAPCAATGASAASAVRTANHAAMKRTTEFLWGFMIDPRFPRPTATRSFESRGALAQRDFLTGAEFENGSRAQPHLIAARSRDRAAGRGAAQQAAHQRIVAIAADRLADQCAGRGATGDRAQVARARGARDHGLGLGANAIRIGVHPH